MKQGIIVTFKVDVMFADGGEDSLVSAIDGLERAGYNVRMMDAKVVEIADDEPKEW